MLRAIVGIANRSYKINLIGLDKMISEKTRIPVSVADDSLTCVVRGCGIVLEDLESLKEVLMTTQYSKPPRMRFFKRTKIK